MVEDFETPRHWKRRQEILKIVESLGTIRISKTELAKKYGVSVEQIRKDFKALADNISKTSKTEFAFNACVIFEFSQNSLLEIARGEKLRPMEKVKALNALINVVDKKIDNLLKLGLIEPAEETVNVMHSENTELYETVVQVARELREEKRAAVEM